MSTNWPSPLFQNHLEVNSSFQEPFTSTHFNPPLLSQPSTLTHKQEVERKILWVKPSFSTRPRSAASHLDHRQHPLVGDGVGADGEVAHGVAADDAVHGVPVGTVGLVPVYHRQVGHHHVHLVLWHLPRKLAGRIRVGRMEGGKEGRKEGWKEERKRRNKKERK